MVYLKPSLQFLLVLKTEPKGNFSNQNNPNNSNHLSIYADGYDVKDSGTIVFYQIVDSKRKISVAAYSADKWDNCLLVNNSGKFCAFEKSSNINYPVININTNTNNINNINNTSTNHTANSSNSNNNFTPVQTFRNTGTSNSNFDNESKDNQEFDEFNEFTMFGEDEQNINNNNFNNLNNSGSSNSSSSQHMKPSPYGQNNQALSHNFVSPQNLNVPGFSSAQPDFREVKNALIEKEIVKYVAEHSAFDQDEFLRLLKKSATMAQLKIDEDSAFWSVANLIKKDKISPKIFFLVDKKNILDMYLKPILNRHWSGPDTKLSNILKILQERDETKEITIIDLVTWLKHGRYFDK